MISKTEIIKDWAELFPELKKYKNLHLNNRLGPLVVGIYLKMVRNMYYTPIFYVHNLCREFPCFTLTLQKDVGTIKLENHKEQYKVLAEKLRGKIYLPLEGDIYIDEIITGYKDFFEYPYKSSFIEYEDLALTCGWLGNIKVLEDVLSYIYDKLKVVEKAPYYNEFGNFEEWFHDLKKKSMQYDMLHKICESEIIKHKVEKLPARKILYND